MERYIEEQKDYNYEKKDTVPMVVIKDEEKENLEFRVHKNWYITLYNKLFGGKHKKT
jgi:hypothetical protein